MAYRRRQGNPRSSSFQDVRSNDQPPSPAAAEPPSLAAQAIRASSAHRDSSISSAYGESAIGPTHKEPSNRSDSSAFEYTSMKNLNETKYGFLGILTRRAKSLIDDDKASQKFESYGRKQPQMSDTTGGQSQQSYQSPEGFQKTEAHSTRKRSDSIASSLNHISGTIKNALEEGLTIVENRTADIIQETRNLNIRRKGRGSEENQATNKLAHHNLSNIQADHETQLKASRDVRWQMCTTEYLELSNMSGCILVDCFQ